MAAAAKKISQVGVHMAIAFVIAYGVTGSVMFGGLAIIIEPVINVLLLPLHERTWAHFALGRRFAGARQAFAAAEKLSQALLHAGVAFAVMYCASGSAALGGLAALLEPVCNVILLPLHDRAWDKLQFPQPGGEPGKAAQSRWIAASAHG